MAFISRLLQFRLLSTLFVQQRLLFALLIFQLGFLRIDLFTGLLQLCDSLLARLVQIAEIGLQALPALSLFTAEDELNTSMFTLAKRSIQLSCQTALLRCPLLFQLRECGIHLSDLRIQLCQGVLRFA